MHYPHSMKLSNECCFATIAALSGQFKSDLFFWFWQHKNSCWRQQLKCKTLKRMARARKGCYMSLGQSECYVGVTEAKRQMQMMTWIFFWDGGGGGSCYVLTKMFKCLMLCVDVFLDQVVCKSEKWTSINGYLMIQEWFLNNEGLVSKGLAKSLGRAV